MIVASYYPKEKGEGTFYLEVYCTDKKFKIGKL